MPQGIVGVNGPVAAEPATHTSYVRIYVHDRCSKLPFVFVPEGLSVGP